MGLWPKMFSTIVNGRNIDRVFTSFSFIVLGLLVLTSVTNPGIYWDDWAYHLPFASYIWNIGGGEESFILSDSYHARYLGFPKFAEWLQGLFWYGTGYIGTTTLINSIGLTALVIFSRFYLGLPFPHTVFGFLAIPLAAIHATSAYIDLFVGIFLAIQFFVSTLLYRKMMNKRIAAEKIEFLILFVFYISAASISSNSKFPSLVISVFISLILIVFVSVKVRSYDRFICIGVIIGAVLLSSYTVMFNLVKYNITLNKTHTLRETHTH